ncbi:MAG: DUF1275 domain-containing protein [Actinomycetota bacterium]|nr:DUF1275 domain-containing protein [Actinomycetota bacterium]
MRSDAPHRTDSSRSWWRDYLADPADGPLPALLLVLTISTGLIDAVSILALGRVFVANMTGNIVFIGFALAGAPGFSLAASLIALAGFLAGAGLGGFAVRRRNQHRGVLLRDVTAVELVLITAGAVLTALAHAPLGSAVREVTVALAAVALGMQNAAARRLAVPDLTTTVLTMTLTGVAADLRNRDVRVAVRRILSVGAMLIGALVGAVLTINVNASAAIFAVSALIAVVALGAVVASRDHSPWHAFRHG